MKMESEVASGLKKFLEMEGIEGNIEDLDNPT